MIGLHAVWIALLTSGILQSHAQDGAQTLTPAAPPPLRVADTLRIGGTSAMSDLLAAWQAAFAREHPQIRFESQLRGTDVGMAALYTGSADLILAGRESTAAEDKAFEWVYRYRPARVEIGTGSVDQAGRSAAPVLFVHTENPLRGLTVEQLQAILLPAGQAKMTAIRKWGDLGLTGEWQQSTVKIYSFDMESGTGRFFRRAVLHDSRKLDWTNIREFTATVGEPDAQVARRIFHALADDRYGLALAYGRPDKPLQALALAATETDDPSPSNRDTVQSRDYPLARPIYAYFNQVPGSARSPEVAAFVDFIRGPVGQTILAGAGDYLPLPDGPSKP